ncbi:hypothetical protein L1987_59841 [Smallanthus sonchifolius]|uniref:Uncharacterized protein n=1 Tax=Smallanthus sonchifolius TaxID=185202 RepID=A0ACB9D6R3_9ASTR|nr:hypothetical protein L1987_59841 [Smallanthus sonchifolius]
MGSAGATNQATAAEATLKWQSENAVAQNNILKTILAQQDTFTKTQEELVYRMQCLESIIYEDSDIEDVASRTAAQPKTHSKTQIQSNSSPLTTSTIKMA